MADNTSAKLKEKCTALMRVLADGIHPKCFLVVTGNWDGKAALLEACLKPLGARCVHLGIALSRRLASSQQSRRAGIITDYLNELDDLSDKDMLLFTDIDILFDPGIDILPINAFASIARNRAICVDWPGNFDLSSRRLSYAESGDPAYCEFTIFPQVCVLDESGFAFPDFNP